jgi:hypothetical protein
MRTNKLWLESFTRSRRQLSFTYGIDDLRFENAYWYNDVDLIALERQYGQAMLNKVYFHIMAFEINKLISLQPATIDFGNFAAYQTTAFETLWLKITRNVWGQWRYEHQRPDYSGPEFTSKPAVRSIQAIQRQATPTEDILCFCGGGKDSLFAMTILERLQLPYASFAYSNSVYGRADMQHKLIQNLLKHAQMTKQHQLWVYDSCIDSPVLSIYPEYGSKYITAAETPSSIFSALPVLLQHGYQNIVLAHEHSANVGNLIWTLTGEEINHQWGKSFAAEQLLNEYLRAEFIIDCNYFSILQPVYDVLIFNGLKWAIEAVPATHSCNVDKPWCCRCPKCAYVWLNYMAYLDVNLVDSIFHANLFDLKENQQWFYQMLGLGENTPFECIGQIQEVQLAFELCKRKGVTGKAMQLYMQHFPSLDTKAIINKYTSVNMAQTGIPTAVAKLIEPHFHILSTETQQYLKSILNDEGTIKGGK